VAGTASRYGVAGEAGDSGDGDGGEGGTARLGGVEGRASSIGHGAAE
jgi:hypothetical protein